MKCKLCAYRRWCNYNGRVDDCSEFIPSSSLIVSTMIAVAIVLMAGIVYAAS